MENGARVVCLAGPHVVHETIDGESVIIDLDKGIYFSLDSSGALIWQGAVAGATVDEIAADLAAVFDAPLPALRSSAAELISKLEEEGLVVAAEPSDSRPRPAPPAANGGRRPFEPPVLRKFTDMQDLLLLDPIHDVDASGWPQTRAQ